MPRSQREWQEVTQSLRRKAADKAVPEAEKASLLAKAQELEEKHNIKPPPPNDPGPPLWDDVLADVARMRHEYQKQQARERAESRARNTGGYTPPPNVWATQWSGSKGYGDLDDIIEPGYKYDWIDGEE